MDHPDRVMLFIMNTLKLSFVSKYPMAQHCQETYNMSVSDLDSVQQEVMRIRSDGLKSHRHIELFQATIKLEVKTIISNCP